MKNLWIFNASLLLFLVCTLTSCLNSRVIKVPERVVGIPDNAIWYGGIDGGTWIKIDDTDVDNQYYVECYFDTSGDLLDKGIFKMEECPDYETIYTAREMRDLVSYFDGKYIGLKIKCNNHYIRLYKMAPDPISNIPNGAIWLKDGAEELWIKVYDTDITNQFIVECYKVNITKDFWNHCYRDIYKIEECADNTKVYSATEINGAIIGTNGASSYELNLICNDKHIELIMAD